MSKLESGKICLCPSIAEVLSYSPKVFKAGYPTNTAKIRRELEKAYRAGQRSCCGHDECEEQLRRWEQEEKKP
jgi:hypothetical protein